MASRAADVIVRTALRARRRWSAAATRISNMEMLHGARLRRRLREPLERLLHDLHLDYLTRVPSDHPAKYAATSMVEFSGVSTLCDPKSSEPEGVSW